MRRMLLILALIASPAAGADVARGRQAYQTCAACHSEAAGAMGPSLAAVVGRPAGAVPSFRYSGPLKRSGIVWTPANLRSFIIDPQTLIPGNRMPFSGSPPGTADDIVAYLSTAPKP